MSAALEPSGQSGVLCVVSPAMTLRSRSGSRLTTLTVALSSKVTIAVLGNAPGAACSAVIMVFSPVLMAPISGPMLPVMSTTSASDEPSTLKSAGTVPLAPTGMLSLSLGSVSCAQSPSLVLLRNSCVKSVSMRVNVASPSTYWSSPESGSTTTS